MREIRTSGSTRGEAIVLRHRSSPTLPTNIVAMYAPPGDLDSVEFAIEGRRIDILCKDMAGVPVVVELKVSRGHERTIGQCPYYRAKIKETMNAAKVRIFVVAQEISPELKLAAQEVPDVALFEYALSMTVRRL
jgi:endonuclease